MSDRTQHEVPYLHVRALKRVVGVGGEAEPVAKILGNRAGLLALREQLDRALAADERRVGLFVQRADGGRKQMGEPREPDRSMFA